MHGRPRVRTTEEQRAAKAKERAAKVIEYRAAMDEAMCLRSCCADSSHENVDSDESHKHRERLLRITQVLLQANPDIGTLWAVRRETIQQCQSHPPAADYSETVQLNAELQLTAACLMQNPKSYGAWHHRAWTLDRLGPQRADLPGELRLTGQFLQRDERNFHCWDHRRHVCRLGGVQAADELAFSDKLLTANMGNFSAWHYRSRLLPMADDGLSAEIRKRELETVLSAMFSDPADTAPWGYYRWLMAPPAEPLRPLWLRCSRQSGDGESEVDDAVVNADFVLIAFSRPVTKTWLLERLSIVIGGENEGEADRFRTTPIPLAPVTGAADAAAAYVWRLLLSSTTSTTVHIVLQADKDFHKFDSSVTMLDSLALLAPAQTLPADLTEAERSLRTEQLGLVRQLNELAGDSRQGLLTEAALLASLSLTTECEAVFERLATLDPMRAGAYGHARSRLAIRARLLAHSSMDKVDASKDPIWKKLSLAGLGLTALPLVHEFGYVEELNLSDNKLASLPGQMAALACLHKLDARNNCLSDLTGLRRLAECPRLRTVQLAGNPVAKDAQVLAEFAQLLPAGCRIDVD